MAWNVKSPKTGETRVIDSDEDAAFYKENGYEVTPAVSGSDPLAAQSTNQPIIKQTGSGDSGITMHDVASTVAPVSTFAHDKLGSEASLWQLMRVPAAAADVAINAFPLTSGVTKAGKALRTGLDVAATPLNKGTVLAESALTKTPKVGDVLFKSNPVPESIFGKGIDRLGNTFTYSRNQAIEKAERVGREIDILAQKKYENEKAIATLTKKKTDAASAEAADLRAENRGLKRDLKSKESNLKVLENKIPQKLSSDPLINTREGINRILMWNALRLPSNEGGRNIAGTGLESVTRNVAVPIINKFNDSVWDLLKQEDPMQKAHIDSLKTRAGVK